MNGFNAAVQPGTFDDTILDDCRTKGLKPDKTHWARRIETAPFYAYPVRPGITFTYLATRVNKETRMLMKRRQAVRQHVRGRRDHGRQRARARLCGRHGHDHRQRVRPHRRQGGGAQCSQLRRRARGRAITRRALLAEADRLMTVCNSCRYCEGLCAVFPAMEMRRAFPDGDLNYLANLCHGCGACYVDCQFSPPHEFDVNVPRVLAQVRNESYAAYAWPRVLAPLFARNGLAISLVAALARRGLHLRLCRPGTTDPCCSARTPGRARSTS